VIIVKNLLGSARGTRLLLGCGRNQDNYLCLFLLSLDLLYNRCIWLWALFQTLNSIRLWTLDLVKIEQKPNTIQQCFLCFSHLHREPHKLSVQCVPQKKVVLNWFGLYNLNLTCILYIFVSFLCVPLVHIFIFSCNERTQTHYTIITPSPSHSLSLSFPLHLLAPYV